MTTVNPRHTMAASVGYRKVVFFFVCLCIFFCHLDHHRYKGDTLLMVGRMARWTVSLKFRIYRFRYSFSFRRMESMVSFRSLFPAKTAERCCRKKKYSPTYYIFETCLIVRNSANHPYCIKAYTFKVSMIYHQICIF